MSQVTKRALENSLKQLLPQKPLNKITIQDITDNCGISRMTFYYHFRDIYDLVQWACQEDARQALESKNTYDTWQEGLSGIFRMVAQNKSFVLNVYRSVHQEQVENYLRPQIDDLVIGIIRQAPGSREVTEENQAFIARAYSCVIVGMMMDWIKQDMHTEPEELVRRLSILLSGTITDALERFKI